MKPIQLTDDEFKTNAVLQLQLINKNLLIVAAKLEELIKQASS